MEDFFKGFGIVVGVCVGVVSGALVNLAVQWINEKRLERRLISNLKFELRFDIKKIDQWLSEVTRYRNAVNSNTMGSYFGYFDLSRFISITANAVFASGLLYRHLADDDIGKLQVITGELSPNWESFINNQIVQNRANFVQAAAAQNVDFWERKFQDHRATLEAILSRLP